MEGDFSRKVSSLFVLLLLTTSLAFGQGIVTGSIVGTVQDQQQAVVSGAKVTAKNAATNISYTGNTNAVGFFALRGLPVGTYTVSIEATGFSKLQLANVSVSTGLDTNLGIRNLSVGGAEEVVNVESAAPLVETSTQAITNTFESKKITDLPTGVNFDALALYTPGVAPGGSVGRGNSNGAQLSVNGQRTRSNNFQIDGQYNNDNSVAGPGIFLENADLLGELQVSNNYSSEYGRNTGSVVNYVTKSGTNAFHGTIFEYYRGSRFDSLNNEEKSPAFGFCLKGQNPNGPDGLPNTGDECSVPERARETQNIFGFTFGGPIIKEKGWFFVSGLWDRDRVGGFPTQSSPLITPTPTGLSQLQAAFPGSPGVAALLALAPASNYFANVPRSFQPCDLNLTGECPTGGTVDVSDGITTVPIDFGYATFSPSAVGNIEQWSGRVDWQLTTKDRVFFRYIRDDENFTNNDFGDGIAGVFIDVPSLGKQYGADWVRTWSPTFVNQFRYGRVFLDVGFEDGTSGCNRGTFTSCPSRVLIAAGNFYGFGMATNFPQGRTVKNQQFQDNATWVLGRHTLKFGGEYDRQNSPSDFLPGANGSYTFDTFDDLIQDNPSAFSIVDGPISFPFKENDVSLYFQDDWRIKDNLTLNLGVRWEWYGQSLNLLHDLAIAQQNGPDPFWDTTLPENVIAPPKLDEDLNNFSPVIGFAWTPRIFQSILGKDKTVIRGGFRVSYDPIFYNIHLNVATSAPTVNSAALSVAAGNALPGLPGTVAFTGADVRAVGLAFAPTGLNPGLRTQTTVSPNLHNPYTEQWSLGMQREISSKVAFEVRYLGNHSVGQFQSLNANPALNRLIVQGFSSVIPAGLTPCSDPTAPGFGTGTTRGHVDCNFRNVLTRANTAFGIYHSLQSRLDVRNWHGVTSTLSYTWSHNIDNISEIFSTTGAGLLSLAQNPFDPVAGNVGNSQLDFRHLLGLQFIYELPFYKNQQGILGKMFGGWQFSTAYRYNSGQPFTPIQAKSGVQGTSPGLCDPQNLFSSSIDQCRPILLDASAPFDAVGRCNNATCTSVTDLRDTTAPPAASLDGFHWLVNNLNSALFFGSPFIGVTRNQERGQTVNNANMSMYKTTKITERFSMQFQFQAFNVFNRAYLGVPGNRITTIGSFGLLDFNANGGGQVNTIQNGIGRRRLHFGLKLIF